MQNLDAQTRQEVVDLSNASQAVKTLANQDPPPEGKVKTMTIPNPRHDSSDSTPSSSSSSGAGRASAPYRRPSPGRSPVARGKQPSSDEDESPGETAVERKRRLAVLGTQGDDDDEEHAGETPAERRRRQAALGMSSGGAAEDSEDEGTERVPPTARRGIRFAPEQERGRR